MRLTVSLNGCHTSSMRAHNSIQYKIICSFVVQSNKNEYCYRCCSNTATWQTSQYIQQPIVLPQITTKVQGILHERKSTVNNSLVKLGYGGEQSENSLTSWWLKFLKCMLWWIMHYPMQMSELLWPSWLYYLQLNQAYRSCRIHGKNLVPTPLQFLESE